MATYVLVHGAWGGAHGWRKLRPLLWAKGHQVFSPSLTGQGERSHLVSPQVNLTTHVTDVVNCIHYEDLSDIVLVGHSYGGMVVTGVVEKMGERVRHLVYLDAFLPEDGQSLSDLAGGAAWRDSSDWLVAPMGPAAPVENEKEEDRWVRLRRVPQPRGTLDEKVRLSRPLESFPFSRTYIKATADARGDPPHPFWRAADRVRNHPAWRYEELPTTHSIQMTMPAELAAILLSLA
jgi:pimeloyl-ACP methyl ester carboxylesterase